MLFFAVIELLTHFLWQMYVELPRSGHFAHKLTSFVLQDAETMFDSLPSFLS